MDGMRPIIDTVELRPLMGKTLYSVEYFDWEKLILRFTDGTGVQIDAWGRTDAYLQVTPMEARK